MYIYTCMHIYVYIYIVWPLQNAFTYIVTCGLGNNVLLGE